MVDSGENPSADDRYRLHNLAFDTNCDDSLVQEWSEFDPALMHNGQISRAIDRQQGDLGEQATTISFLNREARKAFFGASEVLGLGVSISPYKHFQEVLNYLQASQDSSKLKQKVLLGYSKIVGPQRYAGTGLAVATPTTKTGWIMMKVLSEADFRLVVLDPGASDDYVESIPEMLELVFRDKWGIHLTLDALEMLIRASEGEIFSSQKAVALRHELSSFATRIANLATSEVIIQHPDGTEQRALLSDGIISMRGASR
jgi:hypothetical protein